MIIQRILAVLAAILLIGAFALATLGPPGVPLGHVLFTLDRAVMDWLEAHTGPWMWTNLVVPLLLRPAWLLPASLGLVAAGMSMTLATRPPPQGSRQPRR